MNGILRPGTNHILEIECPGEWGELTTVGDNGSMQPGPWRISGEKKLRLCHPTQKRKLTTRTLESSLFRVATVPRKLVSVAMPDLV